MSRTPSSLLAFAFIAIVGLALPTLFVGFVTPVEAQGPPLPLPGIPDPNNATAPDQNDQIHILATPRESFAAIEERSRYVFEIEVTDASLQGSEAYSGVVFITCTSRFNQTVDRWGLQEPPPAMIARHETIVMELAVTTAARPAPEVVDLDVTCVADAPLFRVVGDFRIVVKALPYSYLTLFPVDAPPIIGPDEPFAYTLELSNTGSHDQVFIGEITAPAGWQYSFPQNIYVPAGESRNITITGVSPRGNFWYNYDSSVFIVRYWPEDDPGRVQQTLVPFTVNGFFINPALAPLVLLTIIVASMLIFFALLARRHVEEQILGKPVPPWRIPEEREMLRRLMREDPDEFYVVRYYLMVEEHQSALLWFEAFKDATKKDRKHERRWYRVKRKQERKVSRLEKAHARFVAKEDKDLGGPERKAERKVRKLEKKLRRKERKRGRKQERRHRKKVKKIEKRHRKKVRKATKKYEKKRDKQIKKISKQNRKRIKKGEPEVPLPEPDPPQLAEPELPPAPVLTEQPFEESRYAKRAERIRARAAASRDRLAARRDRRVAKDRARTDIQQEKLLAKIPPEPKTHLYDTDEYVPEDQVIVESDRSTIARWLNLPTLQEREEDRRRRAIFAAQLKAAQAEGDAARVESIKSDFASYRKRRGEARKAAIKDNLVRRQEQARLEKERQKRLRLRAKELAAEAKAETRAGQEDRIAVGERAPGELPEAGEPRGLRARLGRKGKPKDASATEAEKKEAEASATESER